MGTSHDLCGTIANPRGAERTTRAHPAPARHVRGLPRYLRATGDAAAPEPRAAPADVADTVVVHRDETTSAPPPSGPSLIDERLELDPEILAFAARQRLRWFLDPDRLSASILDAPYAGRPAFLTAPAPTPGSPLVPAGAGPKTPRGAKAGDLLSGVLKVPTVDRALDRLKDDAADRAAREWRSLSLGEKSLVVTGTALIGGGAIAGIASDPDARSAVIGLFDGRVVPVPYTEGTLGLELNTKGDNLMLGVHLDVGRFLPKSLGFGPGSPKALGAPPVRRAALDGGATIARTGGCACGGTCGCGTIRLSQPGDPEEVEADRIADDVMRTSLGGPEPVRARHRDEDGDQGATLQRSASSRAGDAARGDVAGRIRGIREAGGAPLPPWLRVRFERRLGADLSHVRVHVGGEAGELAAAVRARAFAVDRSIVFGSGEYAPATPAGQRLLAHELAHVLQHDRTVPRPAPSTSAGATRGPEPAGPR